MTERSRLEAFFTELRRRKVHRAAAVYAIVALAVIEGAGEIVPALFLPDSVARFVVIVALLGFPLTLVIAWQFEWTPKGLRREKSAEEAAATGGVSRRWRPGAAVAVVLAVSLLLWRPWQGLFGDSLASLLDESYVDSVAVLPVENVSGDSALDPVRALLTEEMVGQLKRLGPVKVSDPFSVQSFVEKGITLDQLSDSLGVAKVVHASLYNDESQLWVNITTTEGESGSVLWTKRYDANLTEGYEAAVQIAQGFGRDYAGETPALSPPTSFSHSGHATGQQAYLIGMSWLGRRTLEGLTRAREKFREAVSLEPEHAEAFAGLSNADALTLTYRYQSDLDGYQLAGRALATANRAVDLEPDISAGHTARGFLASRAHAPLREVVASCRRAFEIDPGAADGLSWCARVIRERGEPDAAYRAGEQAIELDPQNAGRRVALSIESFALDQYDRAVEEARAARSLQPGLSLPMALEGRGLLLAGRLQECAEMDAGPHDVLRATCLHALGDRTAAMAIVDSVVTVLGSTVAHDTVYSNLIRAEDLAIYYAWLGDAEQSLTWIRFAFDLSPYGIDTRFLESDLFAHVRDAPGFERTVRERRAESWPRVRREAEAAALSLP
jgi:TolB-like protein